MPLIQQGEAIEHDGRVWRRYIFDNLGKAELYAFSNAFFYTVSLNPKVRIRKPK